MKNFFNTMGFRKQDEMEKSIVLKAQRNALLYVVMALMVWSFYETYKVYTQHTKLNLIPCFLLVTTSLINGFSQLYFQKKAVAGDEEYKESKAVYKIVTTVLVVICIIASGVAWLIVSRN